MGEPFCFNTGVGAPLGPSRSHCFGTGGGWTFFIFGILGGGSHPSIKKSENIRAQDTLRAVRSRLLLSPGGASTCCFGAALEQGGVGRPGDRCPNTLPNVFNNFRSEEHTSELQSLRHL